MARAKYYPSSYLVYLFDRVGSKAKTESGFESYLEAAAWRDENKPEGGSGVILRVIHNSLIDLSKDAWAWEDELPEEEDFNEGIGG